MVNQITRFLERNKTGGLIGLIAVVILTLLVPIENTGVGMWLLITGLIFGLVLNPFFQRSRFIAIRRNRTLALIIAVVILVFLLRFIPGSELFGLPAFPAGLSLIGGGGIATFTGIAAAMAAVFFFSPKLAIILGVGALVLLGVPLIGLTVFIAQNGTLIAIIIGMIVALFILNMLFKGKR